MIKEYAVEPEAFFKNFLRLYTQFEPCRGRLIAALPKNWFKAVLSSCPSGYHKTNNLITVLDHLERRKTMSAINRTFDGQISWLQNAFARHAENPFDAILAFGGTEKHSALLSVEDLFEMSPLWECPTSRVVERNAEAMAACIYPLIRHSRQVIFIDPYFWRLTDRNLAPLRLLLERAVQERLADGLDVSYHTADTATLGHFETHSRLAGTIPVGMEVKIVLWPEDVLHNRYVLTDIGGLDFGTGLDENDDPDGGKSDDDVKLLDHGNYEHRWLQYTTDEGPSTVITGKRRIN